MYGITYVSVYCTCLWKLEGCIALFDMGLPSTAFVLNAEYKTCWFQLQQSRTMSHCKLSLIKSLVLISQAVKRHSSASSSPCAMRPAYTCSHPYRPRLLPRISPPLQRPHIYMQLLSLHPPPQKKVLAPRRWSELMSCSAINTPAPNTPVQWPYHHTLPYNFLKSICAHLHSCA